MHESQNELLKESWRIFPEDTWNFQKNLRSNFRGIFGTNLWRYFCGELPRNPQVPLFGYTCLVYLCLGMFEYFVG